ncbi:MAG: chloride channel protein [Acutalibacteraceae bacterium]|nr:chloride channel protein [Acutalibacteraceae bacterium]
MKTKNIGLKKTILYIFKWLLMGILMGIVCGAMGTLFAKAVAFVTNARNENGFLLYFLLPCGILSVFLYKLLRVDGISTDSVIGSVNGENQLNKKIVPAIFGATLISQAFGASVGKEGAALQLGGGIAAAFSQFFKLNKEDTKILTVCGMGAFFASLFGTPIGACIFAVEVAFIGKMVLSALFPTLLSCIIASCISNFFGVEGEHFLLTVVPEFSFYSIVKVISIAVAAMAVGFIFVKLLHLCEKWSVKVMGNPYLRIALGAVVIIILTLALGNNDYNGAGAHIIHKVMNGEQVNSFAFLLKILFTVVSVGAGFKGGEIVPTFFIGATLGSVMASVVGLDSVFASSVGMTALFCFVTKCPLASFVLASEMFGLKGAVFYLVAVIFSFLPIKNTGLYRSQKSNICKIDF